MDALSNFLTYEDPIRNIENKFLKEVSNDLRVYYALHLNPELVLVFGREEQSDGSVVYRAIYEPVITYDLRQNRR